MGFGLKNAWEVDGLSKLVGGGMLAPKSGGIWAVATLPYPSLVVFNQSNPSVSSMFHVLPLLLLLIRYLQLCVLGEKRWQVDKEAIGLFSLSMCNSPSRDMCQPCF